MVHIMRMHHIFAQVQNTGHINIIQQSRNGCVVLVESLMSSRNVITIVLPRSNDHVYICLFVNIEIKTFGWHIQQSGVVLKTI